MSIPRERKFNKQRPCPACSRPDWCYMLEDGAAFWCGRVPSYGGRLGTPRTRGGWVHRLTANQPPQPYLPRPKPAPAVLPDFAAIARRAARCTDGPVDHLAGKLGLLPQSLRRLRVGWISATDLAATGTHCKTDGAWSFPMSDGDVRPLHPTATTIGVRLRGVDGFKYAVSSSLGDGLFIPTKLGEPHTLILPEGPTSTAAMLQLGFAAVGRPNNMAGAVHLFTLLRRVRPRRVVVMGDNDLKTDGTWPGLTGAYHIAEQLGPVCFDLRILLTVMLPPETVKDARAWLNLPDGGPIPRATVATVHAAIQASAPYTNQGRRSA